MHLTVFIFFLATTLDLKKKKRPTKVRLYFSELSLYIYVI